METGGFQQSLIASGQAQLPVPVDRNAFIPAQYEQAVLALIECQTIDEARTFDSAADALAAWARMYSDDRASHAARVLKLHAYRRIGILARQIQPDPVGKPRGTPGPHGVLIGKGFKSHSAQAALRVAKMPEDDFERVTRQRRPPSPGMLSQITLRKNPEWARVSTRLAGLASILRNADIPAIVATLDDQDLAAAERRIEKAMCALSTFNQQIGLRRTKEAA